MGKSTISMGHFPVRKLSVAFVDQTSHPSHPTGELVLLGLLDLPPITSGVTNSNQQMANQFP